MGTPVFSESYGLWFSHVLIMEHINIMQKKLINDGFWGWSFSLSMEGVHWTIICWLVVWLPFFIFPYIGNNHPNWLIFFRGVAQPPTSLFRTEKNLRGYVVGPKWCLFDEWWWVVWASYWPMGESPLFKNQCKRDDAEDSLGVDHCCPMWICGVSERSFFFR